MQFIIHNDSGECLLWLFFYEMHSLYTVIFVSFAQDFGMGMKSDMCLFPAQLSGYV